MSDIFESDCEVLVNPVNCVGVMGAGLALQFKNRYPNMFEQYVKDCDEGYVHPGTIRGYDVDGKVIFNVATKEHWRHRSRLHWIERALSELGHKCHEWGVNSVAIPPLGCGLGGLDWGDVEPLIKDWLTDHTDWLRVEIYPPEGERYLL